MSETNIHLEVHQDSAPENSQFTRAHRILLLILGSALVIWLLSGIYQVKADQIAIVERLGEYISTSDGKAIQIGNGLHYHLPWPIDTVHIISTQQAFSLKVSEFNASLSSNEEFKFQKIKEGMPKEYFNALFDPYLITGDKSVVHMEINVTYRINDPEAWLNTVSHESDTGETGDTRSVLFQQLSQRAMISQVAHLSLQDLLFNKRSEVQLTMSTALEHSMAIADPSDAAGKKRIDLGVQIQKVDISELRPPDLVKDAFTAVANARAYQTVAIQNAGGDAAAAKIKAQGEMTTLNIQAQVYANRTVEGARGDSDRFKEILIQYNNAPDVTRWNLYTDAAQSVFGNAQRIIFAQPGQRTYLEVGPPQYDANQVNANPVKTGQ